MHHIDTDGSPVNARPHRLALKKLKAAHQELEDIYVGTRSHPSFFKPVGITTAHGPKDFRGLAAMCGLSSIKSYYPIRPIPDSQNPGFLSYSSWSYNIFKTRFSLCIPSNMSLRHLKTYRKQSSGLLEFLRMPFGHKNAAQTYQCFIDEVLRGLLFSYAYIDDVLVASMSTEEHN